MCQQVRNGYSNTISSQRDRYSGKGMSGDGSWLVGCRAGQAKNRAIEVGWNRSRRRRVLCNVTQEKKGELRDAVGGGEPAGKDGVVLVDFRLEERM